VSPLLAERGRADRTGQGEAKGVRFAHADGRADRRCLALGDSTDDTAGQGRNAGLQSGSIFHTTCFETSFPFFRSEKVLIMPRARTYGSDAETENSVLLLEQRLKLRLSSSYCRQQQLLGPNFTPKE
jgi:hypothetical protein